MKLPVSLPSVVNSLVNHAARAGAQAIRTGVSEAAQFAASSPQLPALATQFKHAGRGLVMRMARQAVGGILQQGLQRNPGIPAFLRTGLDPRLKAWAQAGLRAGTERPMAPPLPPRPAHDVHAEAEPTPYSKPRRSHADYEADINNRPRPQKPTPPKGEMYVALGLEPDATAEHIKAAYRREILKTHPDRVPEAERPAAHARFIAVKKAYDTLIDPQKRQTYDNTVAREAMERQAASEAAG